MTSKYFRTGYQFLKSGLGGTKKADQIKKANKTLKSLEETMTTNKMSPELKERGEKLKKEVKQTQKEIYKAPSTKGFKKGGRIGFNQGTGRTGVPAMDIKSKIAKKKKNKGKFPDVSGDGKITKKDVLMARGVIPKPKNKKVIS